MNNEPRNLHTLPTAPIDATMPSTRGWQTPTVLMIDSLGHLERGKHYLLIGRRRWNFAEMPDGDFRFVGAHYNEPEKVDLVDAQRVFSQSELEALVKAGMLFVDHPTMVSINPTPGAHTR